MAHVLASGVSLDALRIPAELEVEPAGVTCGIRVRGLDLASDLPGEQVLALRQLADHAGYVVVEGQRDLPAECQQRVCDWLGGPYLPPRSDDGLLASRREYVNRLGPDGGSAGQQTVHPHSDNQPAPLPPDFTLLYAVEVPPPSAGGNTYYANCFQAFAALDETLRDRLRAGRQRMLSQKWGNYRCFDAIRESMEARGLSPSEDDETSEVLHPVVRTHPVSGVPALWVSDMTDTLVGREDPSELAELTRRLQAHVRRDEFYSRHEWSPGQLVIWDNRCVLHRREAWDPAYTRIMVGAQAGCSRPF